MAETHNTTITATAVATSGLQLSDEGDDVRALQTNLAILGATIADSDTAKATFGQPTQAAVAAFQREHRLAVTGVVDATTAAAITEAADAAAYVVTGLVSCPDRAGLGGLAVSIVDKNVGNDVVLATTTTAVGGAYQVRFGPAALVARKKAQPDLQASVSAGGKVLATSIVRYNAPHAVVLDVGLPAGAAGLPPEHTVLTAALAEHYTGRLADLKQTATQQDVTYLANKTGWDARAVALAALADGLARTGKDQLAAPLYYALLRAGLPADATLYQTGAATVSAIWTAAAAQGVIAPPDASALAAYQTVAAAAVLDTTSPNGTSTLRQLLSVSLGNDTQAAQFAAIQVAHREDPTAMWSAVTAAFGAATTAKLQLDGQLAYLTFDNAPLISRVHDPKQPKLATAIDLVAAGYHQAATWTALLAGVTVPQVPGATGDATTAYANLLAARVRISFPTAVAAANVRGGTFPVAGTTAGLQGQVADFLVAHQADFAIGAQPIEQYIAQAKVTASTDIVTEIKRFQRVYQLTTDDTAMSGLLTRGLDSAYRIARFDRGAFVRTYTKDVGGDAAAGAIHDRALQVHHFALSIATHYTTARKTPAFGNPASPYLTGQASPPSDPTIIAYPTLETLFGSMDYCECDDCNSILSPAAYLVDLLDFIDVAPPGAPFQNPLDVLLGRRPDLAALPLTCDNTNTALPYIDLVNETLEYFVHHGSLASFAGHDTDDTVTSAELIAAPQFTDTDAYTALRAVQFPPPMPFDRDLGGLRRTFTAFNTPLYAIMEPLRVDDSVDPASPTGYGWRDILIERLGISRDENTVFTETAPTLQALYGYTAATPDATVIAALSGAKAFARRLQITYEDVVSLLETQFINPSVWLVPLVQNLGITFQTIAALKAGTLTQAQSDALDQQLSGIDPTDYGPTPGATASQTIRAWLVAHYDAIMGLIVLTNPADPTDLCSFDTLQFAYANPSGPSTLRTTDFVRLLRFVRLWQKLGLSIDQTDQALTALFPAITPSGNDVTDLAAQGNAFETFLPRFGSVYQVIDRLALSPDSDLPSVLTCFAPMDTYGDTSLYHTLFQTPTLLQLDPAFDADANGVVPKGDGNGLLAHGDALRAGCGLTATELSQITSYLGYDSSTKFDIDGISAVFRHGWLARALEISVVELLGLLASTFLDPFGFPDPPLPPVSELLALVATLATAGLTPAQALYLIWNQDLSGQSAPSADVVAATARTLRETFAAVDADFAPADDPTGALASARLALVYGSDATAFYLALLDQTLATSAPYDQPTGALDPAVATAGGALLTYDDFKKQLTWAGELSTAQRDAIAAAAPSDAALATAINAIYTASQATITAFFARYPELQAPATAFLASTDQLSTRWTALLAALLPALAEERKRQQAITQLASTTGTDAAMVQALLDDATVMHADGSATAAALDDVVALEQDGLAAAYTWAAQIGPTPNATDPAATPAIPTTAPPGSPVSATWTGYLEAPASGDLNLAVDTDASATVAITFGGTALALAHAGTRWSNSTALAVTGGTLYPITVTVSNATTQIALSWETTSTGWQAVPSASLYSQTLVDRFRRVDVTYLKAATLASALALSAPDMAHLGADPDLAVTNLPWLDVLPDSGGASPAVSQALRTTLVALCDYARLKAAISPGDERLLAVIQAPTMPLSGGGDAIAALTGWDGASIDALLARFGATRANLVHVETFRRLSDAYALVTSTGLSAASLVAAATNTPSPTTVAALQSALRARYDETDWLTVLQPINDDLRKAQRDALVAYILNSFAQSSDPNLQTIDTGDKLYEYFLMDVLMDPCMETSRIRNALSSIQLFIDRCLLNLEPSVSSVSVNADWWTWMKRYRVWQANREVFLWPENWLYPELRDKTSTIFDETMAELLQGDITDDTAATALQHYLTKLEEVARLAPCGIYIDDSGSSEVVHVIGCSDGAHRKYYYRYFQDAFWSPWEVITADVEDLPIVPVVWNGRTFAIWLRIIAKNPDPSKMGSGSNSGTGKGKGLSKVTLGELQDSAQGEVANLTNPVHAVLCYAERVDGAWQPTKTSNLHSPLDLGSFPPTGTGAFDRTGVTLAISFEAEPDPAEDDRAMRITITGGGITGSASFVLYNTHASPVPNAAAAASPILIAPIYTDYRTIQTDAAKTPTNFSISYERSWLIQYGKSTTLDRSILDNPSDDAAVASHNPVNDVWDAPLLYGDARHVFYVTTTDQQVSIPDYTGYGPSNPSKWIIPSLVFATNPYVAGPDPAGPVEGSRDIGVETSGPAIDQFVRGGDTITNGLASLGTVSYGNFAMGVAGGDAITTPAANSTTIVKGTSS